MVSAKEVILVHIKSNKCTNSNEQIMQYLCCGYDYTLLCYFYREIVAFQSLKLLHIKIILYIVIYAEFHTPVIVFYFLLI